MTPDAPLRGTVPEGSWVVAKDDVPLWLLLEGAQDAAGADHG